MITNVQPLHNAGPADLTFFDNRKYTGQLVTTLAGACILASVDAGRADRHGDLDHSRTLQRFRPH